MELQKIEPNVGYVDLIDENSCMGNSLDIINTNVMVLSSNLQSVTRDLLAWQQLCTLVSQFSATLQSMSLGIQRISHNFPDTFTTVNALSSLWNTNIFSLFYPKIFEYTVWTSNPQLSLLTTWFNKNFPADNYSPRQIVNLYVKLYKDNQFSFNFKQTYIEMCTPNAGSVIVQCAPCEDKRKVIACNQDVSQNGVGQHICSDAKNQCNNTTPNIGVNFSCAGTGGMPLTVSYATNGNNDYFDRFLYKSISYVFISNPDPSQPNKLIWSLQSN